MLTAACPASCRTCLLFVCFIPAAWPVGQDLHPVGHEHVCVREAAVWSRRSCYHSDHQPTECKPVIVVVLITAYWVCCVREIVRGNIALLEKLLISCHSLDVHSCILVSISSTLLLFAGQHCGPYREPDLAMDSKRYFAGWSNATHHGKLQTAVLCRVWGTCVHVCVCVCEVC